MDYKETGLENFYKKNNLLTKLYSMNYQFSLIHFKPDKYYFWLTVTPFKSKLALQLVTIL
jgi:hypothetical protein